MLPEIARKSYFQHSHKRVSRLTMLLYHARSRVEQMQEEHTAVTRTVSRCLVPQLLSTITLLDPRKLHPGSEPRWLLSQYRGRQYLQMLAHVPMWHSASTHRPPEMPWHPQTWALPWSVYFLSRELLHCPRPWLMPVTLTQPTVSQS